jgi:Domain of unknown function (DUF4471)
MCHALQAGCSTSSIRECVITEIVSGASNDSTSDSAAQLSQPAAETAQQSSGTNTDTMLPTDGDSEADAAQQVNPGASSSSSSPHSTSEQQKKLEEQQELEAALNAVMAQRAGRFKLHIVCGDFVKQLSAKRTLQGAFNVATVGVMHAHLLRSQHRLRDILAPGAVVLVESAQNLLQVRFPICCPRGAGSRPF